MPEYKSWDVTEDTTPLWDIFCSTPPGTRFQFTGDFGTQHGVHTGNGTLELQSLIGEYKLAIGDPAKGYAHSSSALSNATKALWDIVIPWEGALVVTDPEGDVWVKENDGTYAIPDGGGNFLGSFRGFSMRDLEATHGPCTAVLDGSGKCVIGDNADDYFDHEDEDEDDITEFWSAQDLF